jgi:putative ABC transport system permease protein
VNVPQIAWKSVKQRWLASSLTALSVALGVMLMVCVLVVFGIVGRSFSQNSIGYHLVVGPKGSDLQLVLSAVYRISPPIENLPYKMYEEIRDDPRVKIAIPICLGDYTEQGGFPIVATNRRYFEVPYQPDKSFRIRGPFAEGAKQYDAVIGSHVARVNGWDLGSEFQLIHGGTDSETAHTHDEVFTVTGVLAPTGTPNDKTVFVMLAGFYAVAGHDMPLIEALEKNHEFFGNRAVKGDPEYSDAEAELEAMYRRVQEDVAALKEVRARSQQLAALQEPTPEQVAELDELDRRRQQLERRTKTPHTHDPPNWLKEVTAVFVRMDDEPDPAALAKLSPARQQRLRNTYRAAAGSAAAQYASELKNGLRAQAVNPIVPMQRLQTQFVGNIQKVLLGMTILIVIVSGVGIFVSIYNSMADRRREIAIMRALGARRGTVFAVILSEAILLCAGGGLIGLVLGHAAVFVVAPLVASASGGLVIDPFAFEIAELYLIPGLVLLASLIGIVPGLTAYRTDVARALAD